MDELKAIVRACQGLPSTDPLQACIDTILLSVPSHFDVGRVQRLTSSNAATYEEPLTVRLLEGVHAAIKRADFSVRTAHVRFQRLVDTVTKLEDIAKSETADAPRAIFWTHRDRRSGFMAAQRDFLEWFWVIRVAGKASRVMAVITGVLSLLVVWCEATVFVKKPDISVISLLIHNDEFSRLTVQAFVFAFVGYLCYCAYATLFRIDLFSFYRLTKHGSDPGSLLFNTSTLLRLAPSICYNYLYLVHESSSTAFGEIFKRSEDLPLLGRFYGNYFPIVIVAVFLITALNLDGRILHWFQVRKFNNVVPGDPLVEAGRRVVTAEQQRRRQGTEIDVYGRLITLGGARRLASRENLTGEMELGAIQSGGLGLGGGSRGGGSAGGSRYTPLGSSQSGLGSSVLPGIAGATLSAAAIKEKYRPTKK